MLGQGHLKVLLATDLEHVKVQNGGPEPGGREKKREWGALYTCWGGPEKGGVIPAWMTLITESPNPHGGFAWLVGVRGVNPGVSPEEVSARNQRLTCLDRSYCLGKPGLLIWTP